MKQPLAELCSQDRNPHGGKYELAVSPYLSNEKYTGHSDKGWYLFANPGDVPALLLCYLNRQATPIVESGEMSFGTLGMSYRCFYDFSVLLADHRGATKSKGEA